MLQDVKFAIRSMVKSPGFTAVAVLSLALGVGANSTIFSIINAIFLNPLPMERSSELVAVYTTDSQTGIGAFGGLHQVSNPNFRDFREQNTVFTDMAAYTFPNPVSLSAGGEPEQMFAELVTGNYFNLLGVKPLHGRFFRADEDVAPGAHPLVVLSYGTWQRRLGGDPAVVGKTLSINGTRYTVVGIAPEAFKGVNSVFSPDLWVPFMMYPQVLPTQFREWPDSRRALLLNVAGRLKPGVAMGQAEAQLKTIATALEKEYPVPNKGRSVTMRTLAEATIFPGFRRALILGGSVLMTIVGLVLLIACSNVANLLMARASARRQEIAVRVALGASRGRLVRQLLTESILIGIVSGVVGLLLAFLARDGLDALRPPFFAQNMVTIELDARVLLFTAVVSILTGVIFGLIPALQASRADVVSALKEESRSAGPSRRRIGLSNVLVVGQVALSIVALVAAGLFLRSLQSANTINPGFETKRVAVVIVNPGQAGYTAARGEEFYRQVEARAETIPGVRSVAWSSNVPLFGGYFRTIIPEGRESQPDGGRLMAVANVVSPDYFRTMGIALLRGRDFTDADRDGTQRVVIVNETLAARVWPGQNPLGRRMKFLTDDFPREVIGVVQTSKYNTIGEEPQIAIYLAFAQNPADTMALLLRTAGDPGSALGTVQSEVRRIDRHVPLTNPLTMPQLIGQSLWFARMGALLLGVMGALALTLATVGLYGLMAYSVSQRHHEIGVRMALGAGRQDVLAMVLKQAMRLVVSGLAIGLIGAFSISRVTSSLLFGVSPTDPITFAAVAAVLLAVAALASYIPAARATRVDPLQALRY